ncbi:hypothetical protein RDI58_027941 [Solanum bulbocastanum]|uniref:Uncharacterized protein n=1 Tax=Solanum bulbocastanum TaxID=147425 RepID=A0AAN8SUP9_SOLBU
MSSKSSNHHISYVI